MAATTATRTVEITGSFENGHLPGTWLLDIEAVTGSIISGTNSIGSHMWVNTTTGEAEMYILSGSLRGQVDVRPVASIGHTAAKVRQDTDDASYWHNQTARLEQMASRTLGYRSLT